MSTALKKLCEIALAREFAKRPALKIITPKIWDENAKVRLPHLAIQAQPAGDELVFRYGIYSVECSVRVEGVPRKHSPGYFIAEVDILFAALALLDKGELQTLFAPYGVLVFGIVPRQLPAAIEGEHRVDMAGCTLTACLLPAG